MDSLLPINALVISGEGKARGFGFPTANLLIDPNETGLEEGVYAAYVGLLGEQYEGALYVQRDPAKVEVHVYDLNRELVGTQLTVQPLSFVSKKEVFTDKKALKQKIVRDIALVRTYFQDHV